MASQKHNSLPLTMNLSIIFIGRARILIQLKKRSINLKSNKNLASTPIEVCFFSKDIFPIHICR